MKRAFLSGVFAFVLLAVSPAAEKSFSPVDYVNPLSVRLTSAQPIRELSAPTG